MEIQNYFDELKRIRIDDIHEAKERFFIMQWRYTKSRSKMETQLRAKNITFAYTNSDKTEIYFRLSHIGVVCNNYTYDVTVYNSLGENIMNLKLYLYTRIELSSLLAYDARIPQLLKEWHDIEPQVKNICEQNFKNKWEEFVLEISNSTFPDPKRITSDAFVKMLKHKIQHWPRERRLQSAILTNFANEGYPFNQGKVPGYFSREFGEMEIGYTRGAFVAYLDYKGAHCDLNCKLTVESVRALAALIPPLYEKACNVAEEGLKRIKLRSINKKTMENLLEAKMQELSLEYALYQWDGKKSSDGRRGWYNERGTIGIELKVKCKNRRCLMFHVRYEKMEQFLKIMDELPKTIETINALPFNALVSIYGNDVKWKKKE
jgi:hypothetical protein